ncbi:hypothetical protein NXW76_15895 [Bacteroides thetaiotaomicron]|nr:hypothetical protein [Bacteroides thetaiotaomicron]
MYFTLRNVQGIQVFQLASCPYAKEKEDLIGLHLLDEADEDILINRQEPFVGRTEDNILAFEIKALAKIGWGRTEDLHVDAVMDDIIGYVLEKRLEGFVGHPRGYPYDVEVGDGE